MSGPRKPVIIEDDLAPVPGPAEVPPVPDAAVVPEGRAMRRAAQIAAHRPSALARLVWWSLAGLVGIAVSTTAWDFVIGLLSRNVWLGYAGMALGGIVALGLIVFTLREIAAFARLGRVDGLQARARDVHSSNDRAGALAVSKQLDRLYASRDELRLGREALGQRIPDLLDADALLDLTERQLMTPLDAAARIEIEAAARQVATVTALVPIALADVFVALAANVRMIRRIAEIYAGRAGVFGSWRLMRAVATHLVATGAVAIGDDMIGSVAGGGVLSKVSRRFGEGVVNGALTARVGIAAIEVCRPLPFKALPKPRVTNIVKRALTGLFSSADE